jgi:hypothetical protein
VKRVEERPIAYVKAIYNTHFYIKRTACALSAVVYVLYYISQSNRLYSYGKGIQVRYNNVQIAIGAGPPLPCVTCLPMGYCFTNIHFNVSGNNPR